MVRIIVQGVMLIFVAVPAWSAEPAWAAVLVGKDSPLWTWHFTSQQIQSFNQPTVSSPEITVEAMAARPQKQHFRKYFKPPRGHLLEPQPESGIPFEPEQTSQGYALPIANFQGTYNWLTPALSWQAWGVLLNTDGSGVNSAGHKLFDAEHARSYIKMVVEGVPAPPLWDDWGGIYGDDNYDAIQENLYNAEQVPPAVYNKIMAALPERPVPEAAYNAVRMNLNLGRYDLAMMQLEKLTSDPAMQNLWLPALHVIGTRAYRAGAEALVAAHFAEIKQRLLLPQSAVNDASLMEKIWDEADYGMRWYTGFHFWTINPYTVTTHAVLEKIAAHDEFYDLVRALVKPTQFDSSGGWSLAAGYSNFNDCLGRRSEWCKKFAEQDSTLTRHVRALWLKTRNILWGYALARRAPNADDIPLLQDMLASVDKLPNDATVNQGKPELKQFFMRHIIRLQLMSNQIEQALQFMREHPISQEKPSGYGTNVNADNILNGGIRLFLERLDLEKARRWAQAAGDILDKTEIPDDLRPVLATSFDELLNNQVPGDGRLYFSPAPQKQFPVALAELLPYETMLRLAKHPKMSREAARALIASGWLRAYLLGGWQKGVALLPELRSVFPELNQDIAAIEGAWSEQSKQRNLLLMLLRSPGIRIRPVWAGQKTAFYWKQQENGVFDVDIVDPNDKNWWCPVNPERVKLYTIYNFFARPVDNTRTESLENSMFNSNLIPNYSNLRDQGVLFGISAAMNGTQPNSIDINTGMMLAKKIIAWHPLLQEGNSQELKLLSQVPNGTRFLSEKVLDWAEHSNALSRFLGMDDDLPEALHLAIRATRYGCRRESGNGYYSYAAYRLLHNRYPDSQWTKKTPYWYSMTTVPQ